MLTYSKFCGTANDGTAKARRTRRAGFKVQSLKFKVQGSRFKVQSSKLKEGVAFLYGCTFLPFFRKGKKDPAYPVILSDSFCKSCLIFSSQLTIPPVPIICLADAVVEGDFGFPAQGRDFVGVQELSWHSIGF